MATVTGFLSNPFQPQQQGQQQTQQVQAQGFFSDPSQPFKGFASQALAQGQQNAAQPFNYSNLGAAPVQTDFSADRAATTQRMNDYYKKNLDERYQRDRQAFDQKQANMGRDIGSDIYKQELQAFEDNRSRAYRDAEQSAFEQGGAEQSRLFNLGLQARQQGVSEANTMRNQSLNEAMGLAGAASAYAGMGSQEAMQRAGFNQENSGAGGAAELQRKNFLEAGNQRSWQTGENASDRGLQTTLQGNQFRHDNDEVGGARAMQLDRINADRDAQVRQFRYDDEGAGGKAQLQAGSERWQATQNDLERALQEKLGTADKGLIGQLLALLGIGGSGTTGGDPSKTPTSGTPTGGTPTTPTGDQPPSKAPFGYEWYKGPDGRWYLKQSVG